MGQRDFLSTSSFDNCNLKTPFLIVPHQAPLDYCLSYCNLQTPFAHYRFDIKNWQNKLSQNTLLIKSKHNKNHDDSKYFNTIFLCSSRWTHHSNTSKIIFLLMYLVFHIILLFIRHQRYLHQLHDCLYNNLHGINRLS